MTKRALLVLAFWLIVGTTLIVIFERELPDPSDYSGKMGGNAMAMYNPTDPSYRVLNGQVLGIDAEFDPSGALSLQLGNPNPDWASVEERLRSVEAYWTDVRMELERRTPARPQVRVVSYQYDWDFNVLAGNVRAHNAAGALAAFEALTGDWAQVKQILTEPVVDSWKLATSLAIIALVLIAVPEALLSMANRLDPKFMKPTREGAPVAAAPGPAAPARADLLRFAPVRAFARSRRVPLLFQVALGTLFFYVLYSCYRGYDVLASNFALLMFWVAFWPVLIVLSLVTVGRMWCAVCPLGALSAAAQRVGQNRPFPERWRNGAMGLGLFVGAAWLLRVGLGLGDSSHLTLGFFALFLVGAVLVGFTFRQRAWCQYVCPVGRLAGLWAKLSFLELRPRPHLCAACSTFECVNGNGEVRGCPVDLHPGRLKSNRDCVYCLNCVKACPYGSPRISLRLPGPELAGGADLAGLDAAFALTAVVVLVLNDSLSHRLLALLPGLAALPATRPAVWFVAAGLFNAAWLVGAYAGAAWLGARALRERFLTTFARFGYMFVPLALLTAGEHSLGALFGASGPLTSALAAPFGLFFYYSGPWPDGGLLGVARPLLYALGLGGTLALPWFIARTASGASARATRVALPFFALAVVIAALFVWAHAG